jgi:hypothetical protein
MNQEYVVRISKIDRRRYLDESGTHAHVRKGPMTIPHEDLLQMAMKAVEKVAQDNTVSSGQRIDELQALRDFCLSLEQMARPDARTSVTGRRR